MTNLRPTKPPPTVLLVYMGFGCELAALATKGEVGIKIAIVGLYCVLAAIWFLLDSRWK